MVYMVRVNGFDHDAFDRAIADLKHEIETLRSRCAELMVELQNARIRERDLKRRLRDCGHASKAGGAQ